jgi:hypothetical protein
LKKTVSPRTPEGKAASSLTHSLSGDKHFILEGEDPEAFLRLLHDHLRPVSDSQESTNLNCIDELHELRLGKGQNDAFPPDPHEPDDLLARAFMQAAKGPDNFTRLVHYETAIERSIERGSTAKPSRPPATGSAPPPLKPRTPFDAMGLNKLRSKPERPYKGAIFPPRRPVIHNDV